MPYKILHHFVGPFPQGRVVTADELNSQGCDIQRLVGLKAIELDRDAEITTGPLPVGPHNRTGDAANQIGQDSPVPRGSGTRAESTGDIYDKMQKKALYELAVAQGVPGADSSWNRDALIAALRDHNKPELANTTEENSAASSD